MKNKKLSNKTKTNDIAISVKNVSKTFRIPHEKVTSIKGAVTGLLKRNKGYEEFKALNDVSFEVKKGEFFGIIGRNGSGKSTLLKILAGIYQADTPVKSARGGAKQFHGVKVNGMISPFLELGIGFNPELSGRDNVYLNATVLGMTKKQIDEKFDSIVKFSELERFIDQKLKNYSSGMQVRLAFSVSIHANRDILLMDEVLAVGDSNFQRKCIEEFRRYKNLRKTVILVTHDVSVVREYCDRAVLINNGIAVDIGNPEKIVDAYMEINMSDEERRMKMENEDTAKQLEVGMETAVGFIKEENITGRYGSRRATIEDLKIFDHTGKETFSLKTGEEFKVVFSIYFNDFVENPAFGLMIRKNPKENLFGMHSNIQNNIKIGARERGDIVSVEIKDKINLNPGIFYITPGVANYESILKYESLDVFDNFKKINVYGPKESWGLIYSKPKIYFK